MYPELSSHIQQSEDYQGYQQRLESDMPAMLAELGRTVQSSGLTWAQWREQFPDALLETVKKYL